MRLKKSLKMNLEFLRNQIFLSTDNSEIKLDFKYFVSETLKTFNKFFFLQSTLRQFRKLRES